MIFTDREIFASIASEEDVTATTKKKVDGKLGAKETKVRVFFFITQRRRHGEREIIYFLYLLIEGFSLQQRKRSAGS